MVPSAGTAPTWHGRNRTTGGSIELTGVVTEPDRGNPRGIFRVDAEGETLIVQLGQPRCVDRSGLKPCILAKGVEFRAIGEPSPGSDENV